MEMKMAKQIQSEGGNKMKQVKKAVGYVCDIPIPGTDMVISKEDQRIRMLKYAEKEGLELACIYEDDQYTEDFMTRPGVQKVLNCKENCGMLLVERVWCLSRKMKDLKPFIAELAKKDWELTSSSYLWDCVSQQVRHRYMGALAEKQRQAARSKVEANKQGQAAA
jgi:DNA invertase Pin-like site-specific DNA recombinase